MYIKQCSICLDASASNLLRKLDLVDDRGIRWSSKLQFIVPEVQVWPNDNSICETCIQNLEVACKFRKQCLNSLDNFKTEGNHENYISEGKVQQLESSFKIEDVAEDCNSNHSDAYFLEQDEVARFICYHCKDSFSLKNHLVEHINTAHDSSQGTYKCGKTFSKLDSPTEHSAKVNQSHICDNCKRCCRTEKLLIVHRKRCSKEKNETPHCCIKCNRSFKYLSALKKHEEFTCKSNNDRLFCDVCDELFNSPQELTDHLRQEHQIESAHPVSGYNLEKSKCRRKAIRQPKLYTCEICQGQFKALKEMIEHYAKVHSLESKSVKPYSCEVCSKRFRSSTNLMSHKLYHQRSRTHTCTMCGKSFITKNDLLAHETTHRTDRNYRCDKCEKSFKTNTNLRTHCLIVHTDPALWKFSCSLCPKKFPMKSTHDQHFRRHTGEKNFACVLCEKAFTSKSELQEHIQYHSNVRRFKCERCDKEYRKKNSLLVHLTRTHGIGDAKMPVREKKHACHLCPGRFPDRVKLARHLCTHSGRKPFACRACDKKFTDKSYLKLHLKNAHKIFDVPLDALNVPVCD